MSTTDCGTEFTVATTAGIAPAGAARKIVPVRIASAWRALVNRMAANRLADLDAHMLDDLGLSRRDVVAALHHSGAFEDPSKLLAKAARVRAGTRFSRAPVL